MQWCMLWLRYVWNAASRDGEAEMLDLSASLWLSISCLTLLPAVKLSWVGSFLTAQQHILGYFVPYNVVEDMIKERSMFQPYHLRQMLPHVNTSKPSMRPWGQQQCRMCAVFCAVAQFVVGMGNCCSRHLVCVVKCSCSCPKKDEDPGKSH